MDYTLSNAYTTDAGTGNRMHQQSAAITTAVTDQDMNGLIWELLSVISAAGLTPAAFDKTVPATYNQLLQALRAAGVFQTPAKFDSTTKSATTAFVKANGVSFSNPLNISSSRNLAASDIGAHLLFQGSFTLTVTSSITGLRAGDSVTFSNFGGNTAAVAFSGATYVYQTAGQTASISVGAGESLTLIFEGGVSWRVGPSTASMGNLISFGSSKSSSGYQKLPGGLIFQWTTATVAAGASADATASTSWPIAFPTALVMSYSNLKSVSITGAGVGAVRADAGTPNSSTVAAATAFNTTAQNLTFTMFGIGY